MRPLRWLLYSSIVASVVMASIAGYFYFQFYQPMIGSEVVVLEVERSNETRSMEIDIRRTALIVIDLWNPLPDDRVEKVNRLLDMARAHDIPIFILNHGIDGDPRINTTGTNTIEHAVDIYSGTDFCHSALQDAGITTLLYTGFEFNGCMIARPCGVIPMYYKGYNLVVISDVSKVDGYDRHEHAEYMLETMWASTTTLDKLEKALS